MGFSSAREKFEIVRDTANDRALRVLAEGLIDLSRAIENDISSAERKLESELHTIKNRVNSLRS